MFSKKCLLIFVHLSNTSRGYPRISNNHISEHKRPPGSRSMDSHNTPNAFGVIYFGRPIVFFFVWHGMTGASFGAFGVLNRLQPLDPWRENVETEMAFFPWAKSICSTYELQKEFGRFRCTYGILWQLSLRFLLSHASEENIDPILLMFRELCSTTKL